jgi:cytochrome c oxidase assembly factor CtaG
MNGLFTTRSFEPTAIGFLLLWVAFMWITRCWTKKIFMVTGLTVLLLCFFSPLHILSSYYLFSAHMTVHVLLLLVVGPLMVLGLPVHNNRFSSLFHFLKQHPVTGWLAGIGTMWLWHIPILFNMAMASGHHRSFDLLSIMESTSLVLAGILFSAPVIHPRKEYRLDPLSGIVYLFTACIGCSLLGLLITFAPAGTYHHFLAHHDIYGLNKIIVQSGITQATDQQAAGLIMWVPCCFIYVGGSMYLLLKWLKEKDPVTVY